MTENEKVTAPVTASDAAEKTPAPPSDPNADGMDIPHELQRNADNTLKHPWKTTPASLLLSNPPAGAADAGGSGGDVSGAMPSTQQMTSVFATLSQCEFAKFRVDPAEIESRIAREADRRWREWRPTKEDRVRHRKSWYVRQVRKEFYP